MGRVQHRTGQFTAAIQSLNDVVRQLTGLVDENANSLDCRFELGVAWYEMAVAHVAIRSDCWSVSWN
jgi:hypothetical protein